MIFDLQEKDLREELISKQKYIIELEDTLDTYERELKELKNEMTERKSIKEDLDNSSGSLQKELDEKSNTILQLYKKLEDRESSDVDYEKIVQNGQEKDNRISNLEDALRESMQLSTQRESVLHEEQIKRKQILEKVSKLEQRLLSLQAAQATRCHLCRPYVAKVAAIELKLSQLVAERKRHLQELAQMKYVSSNTVLADRNKRFYRREALESAISEKDAHLALLEISGIRNARQAEEVERLQVDKRRLVEKLKEEVR